jgi:hypothetical protein
LFARIDHFTNTDGDYWQVGTDDGTLSTYGAPRPKE